MHDYYIVVVFLQNSKIDDLLTTFISSLCNCTEFCIKIDAFNCLNNSVAILSLTLQGRKAVKIYNTLKILIQRMDVHITGSNYYLSSWCNVNTTNYFTPALSVVLKESHCDIKTLVIIFLSLILAAVLTVVIARCCSTVNHDQMNVKKQGRCFNVTTEPTTKKLDMQHYSTLLKTV